MLHSHFLIIRQQVSCVKTTPWEGPHKYALQTACIFTCMDGPLEPYSWWELAWTPNPLCRAAVGVNAAVTKHVSRSILDTGIGNSPRVQRWAREQPDTHPEEQDTRVSGQRHWLILWHCSNVLGAFFTPRDSGTWVRQDLNGICVGDELDRAEDLLGKCEVFKGA